MVQVALELDFLITMWHPEQVSKLWKVTQKSSLLAGGCSKSEFGMVIVASRMQQLHERKPPFRRSPSVRLRAMYLRCNMVSQTQHVALLWLSRKTCPHLQHRI